jgi:hypothetical protein
VPHRRPAARRPWLPASAGRRSYGKLKYAASTRPAQYVASSRREEASQVRIARENASEFWKVGDELSDDRAGLELVALADC